MDINNVTNSISLSNSFQAKTDSTSSKSVAPESVSQAIKDEVVKDEVKSRQTKTNEDTASIVETLNKSLDPFNTKIKFGLDKDDVYYVSVIDTETNKILRRFPKEQAAQLVPKMQEVVGILFDEKG